MPKMPDQQGCPEQPHPFRMVPLLVFLQNLPFLSFYEKPQAFPPTRLRHWPTLDSTDGTVNHEAWGNTQRLPCPPPHCFRVWTLELHCDVGLERAQRQRLPQMEAMRSKSSCLCSWRGGQGLTWSYFLRM